MANNLTPEAQAYLDKGGTLINNQIPTQKAITPGYTPEQQAVIKSGAANAYDFGFPKIPAQITSSTLAPAPPPIQTTPKSDTTNYNGTVAAGQAYAAQNAQNIASTAPTTPAPAFSPENTIANLVTDYFTKQDKAATDYQAKQDQLQLALTGGQTPEQVALAEQEAKNAHLRAISAARQAQAEAAAVQAEIQTVISSRDADNRLFEQQVNQGLTAAGGADAVMNASAFNARVQERNRLAAIEVLPLQAKLLGVQANVQSLQGFAQDAQDTLAAAQDILKKVVDFKKDEIKRTYDLKKDQQDELFKYLTEAEKTKLANLKTKQTQDRVESNAAINDMNAIQSALFSSGNTALAVEAGQRIAKFDPEAPNPAQEIRSMKNDVYAIQARAVPKKQYTNPIDENGQSVQYQLDASGRIIPTSRTVLGGQVTSGNANVPYVPGTNPTVDNWARLVISGQAKITEVPNPRGSNLRSQVVDAIATSGQLLLSDKDREKLSTLDTAFNVANTIKSLSEKINTFDVVGRVTGYLNRYLGGALQYNVDIARFNAAREGFVSNVARTLGEKGTLAEGDVRRAIENLPTKNDTKDVAEAKLKTLFSILEGTKESIIQKSTEPLKNITAGTLIPTDIKDMATKQKIPDSELQDSINKYGIDAVRKFLTGK